MIFSQCQALTSSFWVSILFGTRSPDEKLIQPGDLKTVEIQLSRWNKATSNDGNKGRWFTKRYLKDTEKYTEFLVCNKVFALQGIF